MGYDHNLGIREALRMHSQTLRYYDRIGLLTPAKVDEWTGYRYYEEEQALLFVKIKNLQQADFSIEEIKTILPGDDELLTAAFERKIREQQQKLERIREIQRSYRPVFLYHAFLFLLISLDGVHPGIGAAQGDEFVMGAPLCDAPFLNDKDLVRTADG